MRLPATLPAWSLLLPLAGIVILLLAAGRDLGPIAVVVVALTLFSAIAAAVHHAEVVALHVGEPFGTLVLAVAVTVIEVALIALLALTLLVTTLTLSAGLTTVLQGAVHLVLFSAFMFLAAVPWPCSCMGDSWSLLRRSPTGT